MLVLIAVTSTNFASDSQTRYAPKTYEKMMVCNLVQDSRLNEAITKLEAKLDSLTALVSKIYTSRPKSTGKRKQYFLDMFPKS